MIPKKKGDFNFLAFAGFFFFSFVVVCVNFEISVSSSKISFT